MNLPQYKAAKIQLKQMLEDEKDPESRDHLQRLIHRASIRIEQAERKAGMLCVH